MDEPRADGAFAGRCRGPRFSERFLHKLEISLHQFRMSWLRVRRAGSLQATTRQANHTVNSVTESYKNDSAQRGVSKVDEFIFALLRSQRDRKSTRLNSSHSQISYAVFCLKKKKKEQRRVTICSRPCCQHRLDVLIPTITCSSLD